MLKLIRPNLHLDSVFDLSPDRLRSLGIDALLLDMDNTLKDYRAPAFSPEVKEWIGSLRRPGCECAFFPTASGIASSQWPSSWEFRS